MNLRIFAAVAAAALTVGFSTLQARAATPEYHVVRTIPIGGDGGWDYLSADAIGQRLYITRGSHVMVVDTGTGKVVGDITGLSGVHGVAIDHKDNRGFISNGQSNTV